MPTSKKRKFERKSKKQYKMVSVHSDVYDEDFILPSLDQAPGEVASTMQRGDMVPLKKWFRDAGVPDDEIDAFVWMTADEQQKFMDDWGNGEISVPKSSD